jgi:citrate lyase subunit beta/citryl-CoA lyase
MSASQPDLNRSSLIVPLSSERFLSKAHLRGADSIILDLEDGVAPNAKDRARARLASAIKEVSRGGATVRVRLNQPIELAVRDIEAAVIPGVYSLGIAKVDSAGHVRLIADLIERLEEQRRLPVGGIALTASIETPAAFTRLNEIASAHPRLVSIGLGSEDIAAACGFEPTFESLLMMKQMILVAAKAAGISSGGYIGSIANYTDIEAMRTTIRRSKKLGFRGGGAIHPAQVKILNEEFSPTAEEIAHAHKVVAAAEVAFAEGRGAFPIDGKMVDKPIIDRARETLAIAAAVQAHDQRLHALLASSPAA